MVCLLSVVCAQWFFLLLMSFRTPLRYRQTKLSGLFSLILRSDIYVITFSDVYGVCLIATMLTYTGCNMHLMSARMGSHQQEEDVV